jgi:hypothetical protein
MSAVHQGFFMYAGCSHRLRLDVYKNLQTKVLARAFRNFLYAPFTLHTRMLFCVLWSPALGYFFSHRCPGTLGYNGDHGVGL